MQRFDPTTSERIEVQDKLKSVLSAIDQCTDLTQKGQYEGMKWQLISRLQRLWELDKSEQIEYVCTRPSCGRVEVLPRRDLARLDPQTFVCPLCQLNDFFSRNPEL